jgi:hypothetical protein
MAVLQADERGDKWPDVLHSIVAGEVDVDRLDYVMRDAQKAGTEFGAIDYARLIDALELHVSRGGFLDRARRAGTLRGRDTAAATHTGVQVDHLPPQGRGVQHRAQPSHGDVLRADGK